MPAMVNYRNSPQWLQAQNGTLVNLDQVRQIEVCKPATDSNRHAVYADILKLFEGTEAECKACLTGLAVALDAIHNKQTDQS